MRQTSSWKPLPAPARIEVARRYLAYLRERDGELDHAQHTLSQREAWCRSMEGAAPAWLGRISPEEFRSCHDGDRRDDLPQDRFLLWVLALAKLNRAESYGVALAIELAVNARRGNDPIDTYIETEEFYHGRLLADTLRCFGLEAPPRPPSPVMRLAIHGMVRLPRVVSMPMALGAELAVVGLLPLLIEEGRALLAARPDVFRQVEALLQQILLDEIGHVIYCWSQLGAVGLSVARALLPVMVVVLLQSAPELASLFGAKRCIDAARSIDLERLAEPIPQLRAVMGVAEPGMSILTSVVRP